MKMNWALVAALFSAQIATAAIKKVAATYTIPASQGQEERRFSIDDYTLDEDAAGQMTFHFTLPEELTGTKKALSFTHKSTKGTEPNDEKILTGDHGEIICKGKWVEASCRVTFTALNIDMKQVSQVLDTKYKADRHGKKLAMALAQRFSDTPIGFLILSLQK